MYANYVIKFFLTLIIVGLTMHAHQKSYIQVFANAVFVCMLKMLCNLKNHQQVNRSTV